MTTTTQRPADVDVSDWRDLDIDQECADLYAALAHIENLRHQHPYDATGTTPQPVHAPVLAPTVDTFRDQQVGNPNTKTNPNLTTNTPETPARPREMAA